MTAFLIRKGSWAGSTRCGGRAGQPGATSSVRTGRSPGSGHTQGPQVLGRAPLTGANS